MLELFKKKKKLPNQDRQIPQTIQELIKRYDLDNTDIIKYLDEIIPQIFTIDGGEIDGDITLKNAHYLKGEDANNVLMYLIRAYIGLVAIGDGSKETRIWSSVKPTINVGGTVYTIATTDEVDKKVNKTTVVSTAGTDLNDYTEDGIYFFNETNTPTHKPSDVSRNDGFLEVAYRSNDVILQKWIVYRNNTMYIRQKAGGTWLDWTKVMQEGQELTEDLHIGNNTKTTTSQYYVENSAGKGSFNVNANGNLGIWDTTAEKWVIYMSPNGTGACNVNAVSATKATRDGDGSTITSTYLKKKNVAVGNVSITPSAANTPTSKSVTWSAMEGTPKVVTTANSTVPGSSVTGTGVSGASSTGATIWLTRNNTNATTVNYIAIYK